MFIYQRVNWRKIVPNNQPCFCLAQMARVEESQPLPLGKTLMRSLPDVCVCVCVHMFASCSPNLLIPTTFIIHIILLIYMYIIHTLYINVLMYIMYIICISTYIYIVLYNVDYISVSIYMHIHLHVIHTHIIYTIPIEGSSLFLPIAIIAIPTAQDSSALSWHPPVARRRAESAHPRTKKRSRSQVLWHRPERHGTMCQQCAMVKLYGTYMGHIWEIYFGGI